MEARKKADYCSTRLKRDTLVERLIVILSILSADERAFMRRGVARLRNVAQQLCIFFFPLPWKTAVRELRILK